MLIQSALSRTKIINKQLESLAQELQAYGAIRSNREHPLAKKEGRGEPSVNNARAAVEAKFQQYRDLVEQLRILKAAISLTNHQTTIKVGGQTMTLHDAILIKKDLVTLRQQAITALKSAVFAAQRDVDTYNTNVVQKAKDNTDIKEATVTYLVPPETVTKYENETAAFVEEVDAALQIANATTHVVGIKD